MISKSRIGDIFRLNLNGRNQRDRILVHDVLSKGSPLNAMIEQLHKTHWERLERGASSVEASSMYGNILDSAKRASGYLELIVRTLLVLAQKRAARTRSVAAV